MLKLLVSLFAFLLCSSLVAQDLHLPWQILSLIDKSAVNYQIAPAQFRSTKGIEADAIKDNAMAYYAMLDSIEVMPEKAKKHWLKGQESLLKGKAKKARKCFIKARKFAPKNSTILTFLGEAYQKTNNIPKAKELYHKAVIANPRHYYPHLLLAKIYEKEGEIEKALEEILLAQLYGTYFPSIKFEAERIAKAAGRNFNGNWKFHPLYAVKKNEDASVSVTYQGAAWKNYALCKAVWLHEPDYRKLMEAKEERYSLIEEQECLLNLVIGYEKLDNPKKAERFPDIQAFSEAVDAKLIESYIFYEIWLPLQPDMLFKLSDERVKNLAKYMNTVRLK